MAPPPHGHGHAPHETTPTRRPPTRPAFNPLLLSSAFYTGPTAYGGAAGSAGGLARPRHRPPQDRRPETSVRPTDAGPAPPISRTAKRILDLLEEYSSPISDAKRVPRPPNPPLAVRPKPYSAPPSASGSSPSPGPANKYRALQLSSSATLLKLRSPRPTHSAIAASLSSCRPLTPSAPSPGPGPAPAPSGYSLPRPDSARTSYKSKVRRGAGLTEECGEEDVPGLPEARLQLPGAGIVITPFPRPPLHETPVSRADPLHPPSKKFRFREPLDLPTYRKTVTAVPAESAPVPVKCWNGDRASPGPLVNGDLGSGKSHSAKPENKSGFADIVAEQAKLWECDSCMTRNGKDKDVCVCCEAPKPGAVPPRGPSLADIVEKQNRQWKCPDCFTGNDPALEKCPCCGAPNPAKKVAAVPTDPKLTGILEKQKKMWECSSCLTRNDRNHSKCVCCEAAMPGSEPAATSTTLGFNFGSTTSSFKFGIDKASDPVETPAETLKKDAPEKKLDFSFGVAPANKKENAPPSGGFKFGVSSPASSKDRPEPTFSFGVKPKEKETVPVSAEPPKFSFGMPNNITVSATPKSKTNESADKSKPSEIPKATFTFGSPLEVAKPTVSAATSPVSMANNIKVATSVTITTSAPATPSFALPTQVDSKLSSPSTVTSSTTSTTKLFPFGNTSTAGEAFKFVGSSPVATTNSHWNSSPQNGSKLLFDTKPINFGDSTKSSQEPATTFGGIINSNPKLPSFSDSVTPKLPTFGEATSPKLPSFGDVTSPKLPSFGDSAAPKLPSFGDSAAPKLPSLNNPSTFSSPSLFPNLPNTNPQAPADKPSTVAPGLFQFGEKPKESHGFPAPVFSFSAQPTTTAPAATTANTNIFAGPTSTNSMFNLNSVTKTDAPTVPTFGSPSTNLFNSKPSTTDLSKSSTNMFSSTALPANPFSSPTGSLFGSAAASPAQPSTNLFASNATKAPVFGSPAVTNSTQPGSTPQFGAPSFNSNLIFGQNAQPSTTGTASEKHPGESTNNLFNINHSSQPSQMTNIFGNLPGSTSTNNNTPVFGSSPAVPTPVFGASTPFGESSQVQSNASAPFKFGASNSTPAVPNAGFGQAPAAGTSAPVFSFGSSAAPPTNSQFNFNMGAPSSAFPSTPGQTSYPPRRFKKAVRRTVMR